MIIREKHGAPDEAMKGSGAGCWNTWGETSPAPGNPVEIVIVVTGDVTSSASADMLLLGLNNCALMCFEVCHGDW